EHHRNLLLSKKNKHSSSTCNNFKIDSLDVISKVVCAICKKCLIYVNHDECLVNYVNGKKSRGRKHKVNVSKNETQKEYRPKVSKSKNVGTRKSLATPKPRKLRFLLRWSPTGKMFDQDGKLVAPSNSESHVDCSNGDNACCSKHIIGNLKLLINFVWKFMGTVRFRNDHVAAILGFGLPKFKYHREHLCPSCEQGKSKRASHPPKPVTNSRQRLHLLHMDLCGPMRIASINGKRYILVIVDDYSRYTWVLFLRSKDEAPENDREDIGKLGAKGDIGFFIGYFADSYAYRIYNRRTKKIMETMNVSFDEISAMAFEQRSSKPERQCMTSRQISSGLDLTYALSTITKQQPTEGELDLLFEAMYDDYFGGQPSTTVENVSAAQEPQVRQMSMASTTIADNVPIPTNSSSHATNIPITSQDVDELNPNAMVDGNTFVNPFATSSSTAAESSSSQNVDPSNMHTFYQPYPHEF
nr:Gag-Pol polyprotein [Tanacetum cinerariifolium]